MNMNMNEGQIGNHLRYLSSLYDLFRGQWVDHILWGQWLVFDVMKGSCWKRELEFKCWEACLMKQTEIFGASSMHVADPKSSQSQLQHMAVPKTDIGFFF